MITPDFECFGWTLICLLQLDTLNLHFTKRVFLHYNEMILICELVIFIEIILP